METPHPPKNVLWKLAAKDSTTADWSEELVAHVANCEECEGALKHFRNHAGAGPPLPLPPPEPPAIPGYEILGEIGHGGLGVVFRARDQVLDRVVAIKLIPRNLLSPEEHPGPGLREARFGARIDHRNIVPVYKAGTASGWVYVVMKLIDGGTLENRLGGKPLGPEIAAALIEVVARAVDDVHQLGIVHRDLKPGNILLDGPPGAPVGDCTPFVADFGIARNLNTSTDITTKLAQGTPEYMAPEQLCERKGNIVVARTVDVYGLGATLYHALTGRPPFHSSSLLEILDMIRHADPVAPRALVPTLKRDLETITLKCLEKSPDRRYPSAGALADDLRRYLNGEPITARCVSAPERALRWCRRRPVAATSGFLATVFLFCLLALWHRAELNRARAGAGEQAFLMSLGGPVHNSLRGVIDTSPLKAPWQSTVLQAVAVNGHDRFIHSLADLPPRQAVDRFVQQLRNITSYLGEVSGQPEVWSCRLPHTLALATQADRIARDPDRAELLLERGFQELNQIAPLATTSSEYHVAASELWTQAGKQRTRGPDRAGTRLAYQSALDSANKAIQINPNGSGLTELVADRRARLKRFDDGMAEATRP